MSCPFLFRAVEMVGTETVIGKSCVKLLKLLSDRRWL